MLFRSGFLKGAGDVFTEEELNSLPLGAITMTVEVGVRFLTDFLNGDSYFKINYTDHNLDRALCQLQLAKSMIKNYDKMNEIVRKCKVQEDESNY